VGSAGWRGRRREAIEGYIGISPWLIGFLVFTAGPMLASLYLSLTDWRMVEAPGWVGSRNYLKIFGDDRDFYRAIRVTFSYVAMALPLQLLLGLGLSLLLNQGVFAIRLFRTLFYIPAVLSGVSVALLWRWAYSPDFGLFNTLLDYVGIIGPAWLGDDNWALPSLIIMSLWAVGGGMIVYLAGLQGIPSDLYEAAQVDGAGLLRILRQVIAPVAMPGIAATSLICIIFSWNEFMFAVNLTAVRAATAPVFLVGFITSEGVFLGKLCAAATLVSLPVLIAGFAAQDKLVQGLSLGAVK
jgi:multiple sugar transport system permease protein